MKKLGQDTKEETIKEAIFEYLVYLSEVKKLSDNTIDAYKRDLYQLCGYLSEININILSKIKETHLNSYILKLEREKKASATVARTIVAIRKFMIYERINQHILLDPSERLNSPKVEHASPDVISKLEVDKIFSFAKEENPIAMRDRAILELLYGTGILVSELIALTIDDIVFPYNYLRCKKKKERMVPLGKHAIEALQQYIVNGRKCFGEVKTDESILFLNQRGLPLSRQGIWTIIRSYGDKANLSHALTPKVLRNSFVIHMLENGADLNSIRQLLGHKTVISTQAYQIHQHKKIRDIYDNSHPRA